MGNKCADLQRETVDIWIEVPWCGCPGFQAVSQPSGIALQPHQKHVLAINPEPVSWGLTGLTIFFLGVAYILP